MRLAALLIAVLLGAIASPALGAEQRASLTDIEDEVMCPICGTLLELSEAPQAERQRVLIAALIAQGKTKEEIKDQLVVEYGDEVLALPEGSGFELSAYLVPAIAFVLGAVAVIVSVLRWCRRPDDPDEDAPPRRPSEEESERLDADLARYDL